MFATGMTIGKFYAWRDPDRDPYDLLKVRLLVQPRGGKAKVRIERGELEGLEQWVATRLITSSWRDRKAFLRDEDNEKRLREASERVRDFVVEEAISAVFTATGESGGFIRTWSDPPEVIQRMWDRAALEGTPREEPLAYRDRYGILHLSFDTALRFARAFAAREPEPCLTYIRDWEDRHRAEGMAPGGSFYREQLRRDQPAHALVRQWAAASEESVMQNEIDRLQKFLYDAELMLRRAGASSEADRLRRNVRHGL